MTFPPGVIMVKLRLNNLSASHCQSRGILAPKGCIADSDKSELWGHELLVEDVERFPLDPASDFVQANNIGN